VIIDVITVHDRTTAEAEHLLSDDEGHLRDVPAVPGRVSVQWYGRQPGADGLSEICVGFHDPATLIEISDEELETQIGFEAAQRERKLRGEPTEAEASA